jgi:hypothetical protein
MSEYLMPHTQRDELSHIVWRLQCLSQLIHCLETSDQMEGAGEGALETMRWETSRLAEELQQVIDLPKAPTPERAGFQPKSAA